MNDDQMRDAEEDDDFISLSDEVADLLSAKRYEPFLHALFRREKGIWAELLQLCSEARVEPPPLSPGRRVSVSWLDHPEKTPGHAVIVFVVPDEVLSAIAIYNRARLLRS